MYEHNEQWGNVKLHQQGILYVKMYFCSGAALTLRILSCFHTAVVVARVCLCVVLSVTPVGRWLSTWTMPNVNTMPGVTQSAYTKPSLPAVTIAFFPPCCLCFVRPHLRWYLSRQGGHKKPRSCLKEESFTIIYINKNGILPLQ